MAMDPWLCAFCSNEAPVSELRPRPVPRRTCTACGAVGFQAASVDQDEIIDEALYVFGVTISPESRGYDALMLRDIDRAGIDMREQTHKVRNDFWGTLVTMWFRRR